MENLDIKKGDLVCWNKTGGELTSEVFVVLDVWMCKGTKRMKVEMQLICNMVFKPITSTFLEYVDKV